MQIFTIINLPWKPWNNKIARSELNHKKNTAQQWLQVKKNTTKKNKQNIYSQPSNLTETAKEKKYVAKFVKYCGAFLSV